MVAVATSLVVKITIFDGFFYSLKLTIAAWLAALLPERRGSLSVIRPK